MKKDKITISRSKVSGLICVLENMEQMGIRKKFLRENKENINKLCKHLGLYKLNHNHLNISEENIKDILNAFNLFYHDEYGEGILEMAIEDFTIYYKS